MAVTVTQDLLSSAIPYNIWLIETGPSRSRQRRHYPIESRLSWTAQRMETKSIGPQRSRPPDARGQDLGASFLGDDTPLVRPTRRCDHLSAKQMATAFGFGAISIYRCQRSSGKLSKAVMFTSFAPRTEMSQVDPLFALRGACHALLIPDMARGCSDLRSPFCRIQTPSDVVQ
jgi:hypothetical protein